MGKMIHGHPNKLNVVEAPALSGGHQASRLTAVKDEDQVSREASERVDFGTGDALVIEAKRTWHHGPDEVTDFRAVHFVDRYSHADESVTDLQPLAFQHQFSKFKSKPFVDDDVIFHQGKSVCSVASVNEDRGGEVAQKQQEQTEVHDVGAQGDAFPRPLFRAWFA